ncbi:MAG: MotE family protein [Desulfovibrionales bacterium]
MKRPPFVTRIGIPRLLQSLMALACIKFALLLGWGLTLEVQSPHLPDSEAVAASLSSKGTAHAAAQPAVAQQAAAAQDESGSYSERWERLTRKEEEINRRDQELTKLERELDAKLARLEALEKNLASMLEEADVLKDQKLKHLVDVYSNMKAREAAQVLESLDEDIAVKILSGMRGRTAGQILSYVQPKKAAKLSESLTVMQLPFEEE